MRPAWVSYASYTKLQEKAYVGNKCRPLRKLFTLLLNFVIPCCEKRQLNGPLAAKSNTQGLIEVEHNPPWFKRTATVRWCSTAFILLRQFHFEVSPCKTKLNHFPLPCFPHEQIPLETILILTASSSLGWEKAENTPIYIYAWPLKQEGNHPQFPALSVSFKGHAFWTSTVLSQGKLLNVAIRNSTGPVIRHRCNCMFRKKKKVVLSQKIRCPRINMTSPVKGKSHP